MPQNFSSLNVSDLTKGERLYLHRQRSRKSMTAVAKAHKVKLSVYAKWESDKLPKDAPVISLGNLTAGEKCVVMRRRSGKTTAEVAKKVGCCRLWLRKMELEQADVARLQDFWKVR